MKPATVLASAVLLVTTFSHGAPIPIITPTITPGSPGKINAITKDDSNAATGVRAWVRDRFVGREDTNGHNMDSESIQGEDLERRGALWPTPKALRGFDWNCLTRSQVEGSLPLLASSKTGKVSPYKRSSALQEQSDSLKLTDHSKLSKAGHQLKEDQMQVLLRMRRDRKTRSEDNIKKELLAPQTDDYYNPALQHLAMNAA